ncbi:radical SAM protein [Kordia sp. YSTF-M3]|uniref:Radical SAM protein n=1 Tax=Kordia aestuariivivens TaxID=2759037 RepID=A0ABR7QG82_9FLAO|nr:radical SAM protein [Kordia aestuariivivens]MBC8757577.1 radical SAM protein [Kordia aestuariivivens]
MNISTLKKGNKKLLPNKYMFAPEWIILGVNNVCNLHCKMCDVGTKNLDSNFAQNLVGTHPINMPLPLIEKIIDQMANYYPDSKLAYAFTEPLVYPHLEASLQYAKQKGVACAITTNALTLKHKAKIVADSNIYISLDGPQDIHNEIRGHKKSFQKAIEGIEEVLTINPNATIGVFCVITEWNIGYMNEFLDFFKDYPLQQIGFMHSNFVEQRVADAHNEIWANSYPATASNTDEVNIDNFDLDVLWDEIATIKSKNYKFPVSFSPEITSKEKLHEYYDKSEIRIGKMCNDVFTNVMIKSDGSVIPAHGRCYNLELGNIYKKNLKQIWNGRVLAKFRSALSKNGGLLPACSCCCNSF